MVIETCQSMTRTDRVITMDIRLMNNGEPEIPQGNPTEVPAEENLPDILPNGPIEVPEPARETPPETPSEVPRKGVRFICR